MSWTFYKILHLSSLFGGFLALGGLWLLYAAPAGSFQKIGKKALLNCHGFFFFLAFVSGFALIAKMKIPSPWPFWLYIKLTVFLLLGAAPYLLKKTSSQKKAPAAAMLSLFALLLALAALASSAVILKWGGSPPPGPAAH